MGRLVPAVTPPTPQPGQLESLLSTLPDTWECRQAAKREQPAKPAQELSQKSRWQTVLTMKAIMKTAIEEMVTQTMKSKALKKVKKLNNSSGQNCSNIRSSSTKMQAVPAATGHSAAPF